VPFSVISGGIAVVFGALFISRKMPDLDAYVDVEDHGSNEHHPTT
jgi:hypothetical protein